MTDSTVSPLRSQRRGVRVVIQALLIATLGFAWCEQPVAAQEQTIGFVEKFVLAEDRDKVLQELVPGTEEFNFWHSLHWQHQQQFEKVDALLVEWEKAFGQTALWLEIRNRQALLKYTTDSAASRNYLVDRLGLHFNHRRIFPTADPGLPVELDQGMISRESILRRILSRSVPDIAEPASFFELASEKLTDDQLRHFLSRLGHPDYPELPELVVRDLKNAHSAGFGSLPIHSQLTLAQLDEVLGLKPDLKNDSNFVSFRLQRLMPGADTDWQVDNQAHLEYLDRLWQYVSTLDDVHVSLKACVLYRRLVLDRSTGVYDKARFLQYLKLPRPAYYVHPEFIRKSARGHIADLNADYAAQTRLAPVRDDEELVRSYLHHFLAESGDSREFSTWIESEYLKRRLAEARITAGADDGRTFGAMLDPAEYKALLERTDIDFLPTNPRFHRPGEPVSIELVTKNVQNLIVKIYEINTASYYRQFGQEVTTDINLDGLVPNWQETHSYSEAPALRVKRSFSFPQLSHRGVFVIDFIGNGKSSRAVVRKGHLRHVEEPTAIGHAFRILDENHEHVKDASLWVGQREFRADEKGLVVVPFSGQPQQQTVILGHEEFHSLASFMHQAELYELHAGIYIDREGLVRGKTAQIVIRPQLRISGVPAPLALMEDVRLLVTTFNQDGIASTTPFEDLVFDESQEKVIEMRVPPRVMRIVFQLQAKVHNMSQDKDESLVAAQEYTINGIDGTPATSQLVLRRNPSGYVLGLCGKTGEPRKSIAVTLRLKHEWMTETVDVTLQTGDDGEIRLGALKGITNLEAIPAGGSSQSWDLRFEGQTTPATVHGTSEAPVILVADPDATAGDYSLQEIRGGNFHSDHSGQIRVESGTIALGPLEPGDYQLFCRPRQTVTSIRITSGKRYGSLIFGAARDLEIRNPDPVHIRELKRDGEHVRVRLGGDLQGARVHVFATRFLPDHNVLASFAAVRDLLPLSVQRGFNASVYLMGRSIGEEYQYILDRQFATRYPGNMLTRPSLLLNPWSLRSTGNEVDTAAEGGEFSNEADRQEGRPGREMQDKAGQFQSASAFPNLDFLPEGTRVIGGLVPDKDGVVSIPVAELGDKHFLRVVAADSRNSIVRTLVLEDAPLTPRDLRLPAQMALDPAKPFSRQKRAIVLRAGELFEMKDMTTARFRGFETVTDVYQYFLSLNTDPALAEFSFLPNWNTKTEDEKRDLYSRFACHELNFFLARKDPAFFESVVKPFLANKYHMTFIDEFLVGLELGSFLRPWDYARLNTFEKALLGHRTGDRLAGVRRFIGDDYELHPTGRRDFDRLFDSAIQRSLLGTAGDDLAVAARLSVDLAEESFDANRAQSGGLARSEEIAAAKAPGSDPAANQAPADLAAGGFGGGGGGGEKGGRGTETASRPDSRQPKGDGAINAELKKLEMERARDQAFKDGLVDTKYGLGDDEDLRSRRKDAEDKAFFRRVKPTEEWVENNYWKLPIEQHLAARIPVNRFWRDFANHDPDKPFLSPYFPEASRNVSEMVMALAVLELPFERGDHDSKSTDEGFQMTPAHDMIAFLEQVRPAEVDSEASRILVSENFFRSDDPVKIVDGKTVEKFLQKEFLPHVVYVGQIVVTNTSSVQQDIELLVQIPEGSIPVALAQSTRTVQLDLAPFGNYKFEYAFYFPATGDFRHYPAQVSREDRVVASAGALQFQVVAEPSEIDTSSWAWISQNGTGEQVLEYLRTGNLQAIDLSLVAWRMRDKPFFDSALPVLRERLVYERTLWSYGLHHDDLAAIREFLTGEESFLQGCGPWLDSPMVTIQPVLRHWYQHKEYWPLVNARAHRLGPDQKILNAHIWQQYHQLLAIVARQLQADGDHRLAMVICLALQDRIDEALNQFSKIDAAGFNEKMQYDYVDAWLAMYQAEPDRAAEIAARYEKYPVKRWQEMFAAVTAQVNEIRTGAQAGVETSDPVAQQTEAAGKEPGFEMSVEGRKIRLDFQNLKTVTVNYYEMDVELLFSRNPFVAQQEAGYSMIRPNAVAIKELPEGSRVFEFELPGEFRTKNVLVEVVGGGKSARQAIYSSSMTVRMFEPFGQLQVVDAGAGKPLPGTYVKVYARTVDGSTVFYKDGYTDLRGRFDYATLSNQDLSSVSRFAILVVGDEQGAAVREAGPPKE